MDIVEILLVYIYFFCINKIKYKYTPAASRKGWPGNSRSAAISATWSSGVESCVKTKMYWNDAELFIQHGGV